MLVVLVSVPMLVVLVPVPLLAVLVPMLVSGPTLVGVAGSNDGGAGANAGLAIDMSNPDFGLITPRHVSESINSNK